MDGRGGYLISAIAFAGITALWAYIVRDDPYYAMTQLLGFTLPVATVFYVTVMPAFGFLAGRWRYQTGDGRWFSKALARAANFIYTHLLIVLFTAAMLAREVFGLNIDGDIRELDDQLFDIAARFAPWLSAYLGGYNLGRAANAPPAPR